MTKVFIINGYPGSGKDTFCDMVIEKYKEVHPRSDYGIDTFSTIEPYKDILKKMGWNGEKTPEIRRLLSDMKFLFPKIGFNHVIQCALWFNATYAKSILFIMAREPQNIEEIKNKLINEDIPVETVFIDYGNRIKQTFSNEADRNVKFYNYDIVIDNSLDLENLQKEVDKFIKEHCEV